MSSGQPQSTFHVRESGTKGAQIYFPLNTMPALGFGTWQAEPGEVEKALKDAITTGYRLIDCAEGYMNHEAVGTGIRAALDDMKGVIRRSDLFITSKLWNTQHDPKTVGPAVRKMLKDLQIEYIDLILMHWPVAFKEEGEELFPKDSKGQFKTANIPIMDTWHAMEQLVMDGIVKNIGVSNFTLDQLKSLWDKSRIKPAVLQIECHPFLDQSELQQFCETKGIVLQAYSPLGQQGEGPDLMKERIVEDIAKKHGKSPAQVLLRYHIECNRGVLTKSTSCERIRDNFNIWDFELTEDDLSKLKSLAKVHHRTCNPPFLPGKTPVFSDAPENFVS